MAKRASIYVAIAGGNLQFNGAGTQELVQTASGAKYLIYVDNASDLVYKKSTDGGVTWAQQVTIFTGTIVALSVYYGRSCGAADDKIYVGYTESGGSDVLFRSIDTASADALSGETTIFAGASSAAGGAMSLVRTRGGNLLCVGCIDAGTETFFARSTDGGATWGARSRTGCTAWATQDQVQLMPGWAADNQDAIAIFWDSSANALIRQVYDDSADSWSETTFVGTFADGLATAHFPHFAAACDVANSRNLLVAWNAVDTANADLRAYTVTESTITSLTDVVLNSTDDQGLCAIGIATDTGAWYVYYAGKSDGSETFPTLVNVYCKVSLDSGTTWGAETVLTGVTRPIKWMACPTRFTGAHSVAFHVDETFREIRANVRLPTGLDHSLHAIEAGA